MTVTIFTAVPTQIKNKVLSYTYIFHRYCSIGRYIIILNSGIDVSAFRTTSHVEITVEPQKTSTARLQEQEHYRSKHAPVITSCWRGTPCASSLLPKDRQECWALLLRSSSTSSFSSSSLTPWFPISLESKQSAWTFIAGLRSTTTSLCVCPGFLDSSRKIKLQ